MLINSLFVFVGLSMERPEAYTPPAVDLSMSPISRHTACSPELANGNGSTHIFSGVSTTSILRFKSKISALNRHVSAEGKDPKWCPINP